MYCSKYWQATFFIPPHGALGWVVEVMKFCPKCGSMLLPEKRGGKLILRCPECGYEEVVGSSDTKEYRIEVKSSNSTKVKTTSVVSEESSSKLSEEELEQEKEEFYEVFLDLMSEEESG